MMLSATARFVLQAEIKVADGILNFGAGGYACILGPSKPDAPVSV
jgi:hypothetical protein